MPFTTVDILNLYTPKNHDMMITFRLTLMTTVMRLAKDVVHVDVETAAFTMPMKFDVDADAVPKMRSW